MTPEHLIAELSVGLAQSLPGNILEAVAQVIATAKSESLFSEISRRVPHHQYRDEAIVFVDRWRREAAGIGADAVAASLRTASLAGKIHRETQSTELAWTGPGSEQAGLRRTEPAIRQVLDGARSRITLVSFAVYRIPNIGKALIRAARRGVRLTVIVETPDMIEGQGEYSTIRALGEEVAACSSVYYWPQEQRPVGENNKPGILHVKCVTADGEWLFLSSANLTQQAFTINMELGVLIRGGPMPGQVEGQFDRLIRSEILKAV